MIVTLNQRNINASISSAGLAASIGLPSVSDSVIDRIVYQGIAGQNISGHRVVCTNVLGQLVYMSVDSPFISSTIGISNHAAIATQQLTITTFGIMEETSWNWLATKALYLSADGVISHIAPITGNYLFLGHAVTSTKILVSVKQPILRS